MTVNGRDPRNNPRSPSHRKLPKQQKSDALSRTKYTFQVDKFEIIIVLSPENKHTSTSTASSALTFVKQSIVG